MTVPKLTPGTAADWHGLRACHRGLRLAAVTLLAWGAIGLGESARCSAESFLTATEEQTVDTPPLTTRWLSPFRWKNEVEPNGAPVIRHPNAAEAVSSPQRLSLLNPFRWKNETRKESAPKPQDSAKQPVDMEPPDGVTPAIATDGPVQPNSVLKASATAMANLSRPNAGQGEQRQPIPWPPEDPHAPTPQRHYNSGQGVNPFAWSNSAPEAEHDYVPPQSPLAEKAAAVAAKPMRWSNDPRGKPKPQELLPPEEPTFADAFEESLRYTQPGEDASREILSRSSPPADATREELIAWEKENLPWIRPFYWADEQQYEIPFQSEVIPPGSGLSGRYWQVLGSPFQWTNQDQPTRPQPQSKPMIAPDVSRDTRRVAFLQDNEDLPQPLPDVDAADRPSQLENLADGDERAFDEEDKGVLAEADTLGEEPQDTSRQFLRADTVLLDPGEWQFDYGFTYTKFDSDFPVFVDTGMGVAVTDANFRLRQLEVPLEIRYGLARRVQMFINVPVGWANAELTFPTFEEFENDGGIGDVTFGSTILLREHCADKPDAILTFAAVAPTGDDPFVTSGLAPAAPSLGNGAWSLASNLLFIQNYDPVVVFYGFGTRQYFLTDIADVSFRSGGEYNYLLGVGFAVNSKVTFSTRFNGAYVSEARLGGERVTGTIQEPMTLSLAMTVAKCKKLVEPFVDFGLTDDAVDARIGITWTR